MILPQTERECARLVHTIRTALHDGLGSASQADKSFPLLIDAAPQLLGESGRALIMVLLERMQREVEASFGAPRSPTSPSRRSSARRMSELTRFRFVGAYRREAHAVGRDALLALPA